MVVRGFLLAEPVLYEVRANNAEAPRIWQAAKMTPDAVPNIHGVLEAFLGAVAAIPARILFGVRIAMPAMQTLNV